jgi:hypothetical protein
MSKVKFRLATKRAGLGVALVLAAAALYWWMGMFEAQPSYQGRTAADWLESVPGGRGSSGGGGGLQIHGRKWRAFSCANIGEETIPIAGKRRKID